MTTDTSGTITVDKGYYNADGTNIIKFTSPVTKTLTESASQAEWKNNVFITLDQQDQSSFVVHNDWSPLQGDYKASKKLETTSIYLDPSLNYILGTEPTGIECTVTPQKPGGTYELKYLTLNGSVNYDETTGKLSGFSTSNYATSSSGITFGSSFDLIFNVTVASASTQQTLFYGQGDSGLLFTDGKIASWFGNNILGKTSVVNDNSYWIRLVWSGTSYTCYSLLDDGTYTLETLPDLSSWTQEFTYSSSTNIIAPGYWIGYHSQATSQYARSTFNMGKAQITTNGVTYRYADNSPEYGSVSFTQGWVYNQTQNRTYQNKNAAPISVGQLKENNAEVICEPKDSTIEQPINTVSLQTKKDLQTIEDDFQAPPQLAAPQQEEPSVIEQVQKPQKPKYITSSHDRILSKSLKEAKTLLELQDDPAAALELINDTLGEVTPDTNPNLRAALHFERGKIFDDYDYVNYALRDYYEATKCDDNNLKLQAHVKMARIYDDYVEFEPAIEHYQDAVAYGGEADNLRAQTKILSEMASVYAGRFDVENTQMLTELSVEAAKESNNSLLLSQTYSSAAKNYEYIGEDAMALENYKNAVKAINSFNPGLETYEILAQNYEDAADVMDRLGNAAKSESLLSKARLYRQRILLEQMSEAV